MRLAQALACFVEAGVAVVALSAAGELPSFEQPPQSAAPRHSVNSAIVFLSCMVFSGGSGVEGGPC